MNDCELELADCDPNDTLLDVLRARGLTGTKEGCAEGECGACSVVWVRADGVRARYVPVQACLLLASALHGQEVLTAEGIAEGEQLHPVQAALVTHGGSQCGYCTPGFVMSAFAEYYRAGRDTFDLTAVDGNLCRCTGYRPIRDGLRSLATPSADDRFLRRLQSPAPPLDSVELSSGERRFFRPTSWDALLELRARHPAAVLIAGGTDWVVRRNQVHERSDLLISLEAVPELRVLEEDDASITLGAGAPLMDVARFIAGRTDVLDMLFPLFGSVLVRQRATLGGNLVTASPIGDSAPALLVLDAEVQLASVRGERDVPLAKFFSGYRQCVLEPDELLRAVRIPKPLPSHSRFDKISKRVSDDISSVAGAFATSLDAQGRMTHTRAAFGGVAATPVRLQTLEAELEGQTPSLECFRAARRALRHALQPIDDVRASAAYRKRAAEASLARFARQLGVAFDTLQQVSP